MQTCVRQFVRSAWTADLTGPNDGAARETPTPDRSMGPDAAWAMPVKSAQLGTAAAVASARPK